MFNNQITILEPHAEEILKDIEIHCAQKNKCAILQQIQYYLDYGQNDCDSISSIELYSCAFKVYFSAGPSFWTSFDYCWACGRKNLPSEFAHSNLSDNLAINPTINSLEASQNSNK